MATLLTNEITFVISFQVFVLIVTMFADMNNIRFHNMAAFLTDKITIFVWLQTLIQVVAVHTFVNDGIFIFGGGFDHMAAFRADQIAIFIRFQIFILIIAVIAKNQMYTSRGFRFRAACSIVFYVILFIVVDDVVSSIKIVVFIDFILGNNDESNALDQTIGIILVKKFISRDTIDSDNSVAEVDAGLGGC